MNNATPGNPQSCGSCSHLQKLVSQEPVYDRKLKVHRPRKKKGGGSRPKFL
jgi:hypothetical protein